VGNRHFARLFHSGDAAVQRGDELAQFAPQSRYVHGEVTLRTPRRRPTFHTSPHEAQRQ
jgi:hypothetical protein